MEFTMTEATPYGLEQARAQLSHILSEAVAGYTSVITRHGKPVAVVVPVEEWQAARPPRHLNLLALRGSGRGLWLQTVAQAVAGLRNEWER